MLVVFDAIKKFLSLKCAPDALQSQAWRGFRAISLLKPTISPETASHEHVTLYQGYGIYFAGLKVNNSDVVSRTAGQLCLLFCDWSTATRPIA